MQIQNSLFKNLTSAYIITRTALALTAIYILLVISQYNYLLFHTTVEFIASLIAVSTFLLAWNARKMLKNQLYIIISIAFLWTGVIDFIHILTYEGMQIFDGITPDLPTKLWLTSRFLLAGSFIVSPFVHRQKNSHRIMLFYFVVTFIATNVIFFLPIFPQAYSASAGLTNFKVISEYIIAGMFIVAFALFYKFRKRFDNKVYLFISISLLIQAVTDLVFTLYVSTYDKFNLLGHILKIAAYFLVYKAIVETGLKKPYKLLFLELKKEDRRKTDFLNIVNHELKNPITVIKANSQFLQKKINGKYTEMLKSIELQAIKAERMINDMLNAENIQLGRIHMKLKSLELNNLIKQTIETEKQTIPNTNISFSNNEKIYVKGDANLISEVLTNLINNAVKYSPKNSQITITSKLAHSKALVTVKDQGPGIKIKNPNKIFEKYYRVDKTKKNGLGIGLYLCNMIIKKHNGSIWVKNNKDKGSTFYFTIPSK